MNGNHVKKLSNADKFLMAGNLASIIGVALVSIGSLLRMVSSEELPATPVFTGSTNSTQNNVKNLYSGRRSFFTE
jgi:hypothetical protein